jgi:3-methyladenine DNA glycosylase AlkD
MSRCREVLNALQALAKPENLEGMAHFGLAGEKRLGIPIPELRGLAK